MKLIVLDDRIIATAKDSADVAGVNPGCEVFYAPDTTPLSDGERQFAFSELGVTQADSDRYEALAGLKQSDADMARVTEDILDALVAAEVIAEADLPAEAQAKLAARRAWRQTV